MTVISDVPTEIAKELQSHLMLLLELMLMVYAIIIIIISCMQPEIQVVVS